eukprot:359358-Chlamydomonas_euryale.AAC.2
MDGWMDKCVFVCDRERGQCGRGDSVFVCERERGHVGGAGGVRPSVSKEAFRPASVECFIAARALSLPHAYPHPLIQTTFPEKLAGCMGPGTGHQRHVRLNHVKRVGRDTAPMHASVRAAMPAAMHVRHRACTPAPMHACVLAAMRNPAMHVGPRAAAPGPLRAAPPAVLSTRRGRRHWERSAGVTLTRRAALAANGHHQAVSTEAGPGRAAAPPSA